jgi:hypothetical protein
MAADLGLPIFILVVILVVGWFAAGTVWNVRKGDRVLKWLREGLPLIGKRTTFRWMGSSAIELKIAEAREPFREAETTIVFEPRDVPVLWAIAHAQGRRDLLILRTQLRTLPRIEFDMFHPQGWTAHGAQAAAEAQGWKPMDWADLRPIVAYAPAGVGQEVRRMVDTATRIAGKPVRLAVRRRAPNLEVHWLLQDVQTRLPRDLFSAFRELAEDASKE